jgi:predicted DNA-binding transcriptional regulator AlpA
MTAQQPSGKPSPDTVAAPEPAPLAVGAKGLAKMLRLSVRTIRTMDAAGKLPRPIRLNGHSIRWPVEDIRAWLAAGAPDRRVWEAMKGERR